MGSSAFLQSDHAEYRSNLSYLFRSVNFSDADFGQLSKGVEVARFQPSRHLRIMTLPTFEFDDHSDAEGIPVQYSALPINSHKMRDTRVRSLIHIALVVEFVPQGVPDRFCVLAALKLGE